MADDGADAGPGPAADADPVDAVRSDGVTDDPVSPTAASRSTDHDGATTDGIPAGRVATDGGGDGPDGPDARTVVVPDRIYRAVTVFSTLFAVVAVVAGFVVLDVATDRASRSLAAVDPLLALVGVGLIVAGAVTYAFSTRFRAAGMGNAKDRADEGSDDG